MVAKSLSRELPVVVGAVMLPLDSNSQELSGISLTPDPDIMFALLQELLPQIRNITVVYNPEQKYGEILRAKQAAQHRGLTLQALQSTDLRHSAAIYQRVLQKIEDDSSAIWLLSDNAAMDEQALLPVVLRAAWEKHFVVVSSNPDHVRKGALISLFPDNFDMGRSLAIMARSRVQDPLRQGGSIEPLRDLRTAVNLRTAEHLGLNFTSADRRKFGLTFPSRP
jgi:putative tryptophan/tyrosine transport system substrate-binding protein